MKLEITEQPITGRYQGPFIRLCKLFIIYGIKTPGFDPPSYNGILNIFSFHHQILNIIGNSEIERVKVVMLLHMYIKGIIIVIVLYLQESCINSPAENSEVSEMAAGQLQESMQMDIQGCGDYDLNS